MKLTAKQIYTKCVVVLVCLSIIGNTAQVAVLCFGADGHVSVEFAFADCCNEHTTTSDQVSSDLDTNTDYVGSTNSCSDCVDIPYQVHWFASSTQEQTPTLKILSNTTISLLNSDSTDTHEEFISKNEKLNNYTIASIRTTVLII